MPQRWQPRLFERERESQRTAFVVSSISSLASLRPRERHGCHQIRQTASVRSPWRCFLPSTLNTLSNTLCRTSQLPKCMLVACDTHHVSQPSLSTSPSPRLRSARRCRLAPVHLSFLAKVRSSRWVQVLFFLSRQWRFRPRPMSSHRATPFRLSRRMGGGVFFLLSGTQTLQSWQNGAHWAKKRPRTTATLR